MQTALCTDELDVLCIILQAGNVDMKEFIVKILDQSTQVKKLDRKEDGYRVVLPGVTIGESADPIPPIRIRILALDQKKFETYTPLSCAVLT
jgi:hypothetical protein